MSARGSRELQHHQGDIVRLRSPLGILGNRLLDALVQHFGGSLRVRLRNLIEPPHTEELSRVVLRFAWHLTSVTWAILALILVQLARDPATARFWAAAGTGVAFTGVGLFDAIATRGRHVGWPLLAGIGIAALLSLRY